MCRLAIAGKLNYAWLSKAAGQQGYKIMHCGILFDSFTEARVYQWPCNIE